jgi:hypothetical protein
MIEQYPRLLSGNSIALRWSMLFPPPDIHRRLKGDVFLNLKIMPECKEACGRPTITFEDEVSHKIMEEELASKRIVSPEMKSGSKLKVPERKRFAVEELDWPMLICSEIIAFPSTVKFADPDPEPMFKP